VLGFAESVGGVVEAVSSGQRSYPYQQAEAVNGKLAGSNTARHSPTGKDRREVANVSRDAAKTLKPRKGEGKFRLEDSVGTTS
jgi:hypothetical protein